MCKNRQEFKKYHDDRFAELPDWMIRAGSDAVREVICTIDKYLILDAIRNDPVFWISPYHHGFGTAIRNLLREKVCTDDQLPGKEEDRNWDNYYTYLIEIAVGFRKYPEVEESGGWSNVCPD